MKTKITLLIGLLSLWGLSLNAQNASNPLSVVAEYNLEQDGTFAKGDPLNAYGGLFKFLDLGNMKVPEGYHIPSKEELMVISGRYNSDEKPNPPYPDLSWNIDKAADEEVELFGEKLTLNSHYYSKGEYVCYAIRFKGGDNRYLSAYKWEPIFLDEKDRVKTKALKVTCRLLGKDGVSLNVQDIATTDFWKRNSSNDVVRYFPTAGYLNYNGDTKVAGRNLKGRYWSNTPKDTNGAWGFGFDADFVMVYSWINTAGYSIRPFKNVSGILPSDASFQIECATENTSISMKLQGPSTISVDWGNGEREDISLEQTNGIVSGRVVGRKLTIYADGVTSLSAIKQNISALAIGKGTPLETLDLSYNKLQSLALDGLTNLTYLNLVDNRLRSLDVSSNSKLEFLSIAKNFYVSDLSLLGLTELRELYVGTNNITELNLSDNTKLRVLDVSKNRNLSQLNLIPLPLLEFLNVGGTNISSLDLSNNKELIRLYASNNKNLSTLRFSSLHNLLSCYLAKCALKKETLNNLISSLPDVSKVYVYANERVWKKQFEIGDNPSVTKEDLELGKAKEKGWKVDLLDDAWSVAPTQPCLTLETNLPVGEEIQWIVENYYDPFWVDWGKWWSSYLQSNSFVIRHAVRQPEIRFYSRGLMEIKCTNQRLRKASLINNDQTYSIDFHSNELTEFILSPKNSVVYLDLRNNQLSKASINELFGTLRNLSEVKYPFPLNGRVDFPSRVDKGKIYLCGNPGAESCDISLATKKGYTVDITTNASGYVTNLKEDFSCYPNPANEILYLSSEVHTVELYTMTGELVLYEEDVSYVTVQSLPEGTYILRINGSDARRVAIRH